MQVAIPNHRRHHHRYGSLILPSNNPRLQTHKTPSQPPLYMRIPSFPHILRTLYALSNYTLPAPQRARALQPFARGTILKSMPTIPFLGSLFSSSSSSASDKNMSYPMQKSDDEWRAVLSKGYQSGPYPLSNLPSLPLPSPIPSPFFSAVPVPP